MQKALKTGQSLFAQNSEEAFDFSLAPATCLVVLNKKSAGNSIAVALDEQATHRDTEEMLLKMLTTLPGDGAVELKIAGFTSAQETVFKVLQILAKQHGWTISGSAFRKAAVEGYFIPREGRLRIQKEQEAQRATRVLVVDDSASIRELLKRVLSADPEITVVGLAERPSQVEAMIAELKPDVITLDIHMPEMDGVQLLSQYLPKYPIPTVMISSITLEEGPKVLAALENGAVDYIQKPTLKQLATVAPIMIEKIKAARFAKVKQARGKVARPIATKMDLNSLIAIGSSTGGTEALKVVLAHLPAEIPPIVIVQHIPPVFSKAFADRMNSLCPFEVKEAEHDDIVRPGRVLIAPGGMQMRLAKRGGELKVQIADTEPVNRHKPSVDVLFDSVVELKRQGVIAVILTGMGADGAAGLLKLRNSGAKTIAQDEASCVVFGMPREAIRLGGAQQVLSLTAIPEALTSLYEKPPVE